MNLESNFQLLYEAAAYDTALNIIRESSAIADETFNEAITVLEAKVFKNKRQLKNEVDKLERSPKPIESLGAYSSYLAKGLLPAAGGIAGIKGIEALCAAGKISSTAAGPAMLGVAAAAVIVYLIIDCCTRINRTPGSISDKKIQYKKLLKSIDESINAWKRKDGDNAKKMLDKLEEAKRKVQIKLDAINERARGKDLNFQNNYVESALDDLLSFDDIRLD